MFKKAVLAEIAMTFVTAPMAQARDYHHSNPAPHRYEPQRPHHGKDFYRHDRRDHGRHQWSKGQRYSDWRRHQEIRDYKRYGLRRPRPGQHWVKVDNQYLLIAGATGLIAGILAAQ